MIRKILSILRYRKVTYTWETGKQTFYEDRFTGEAVGKERP